MRKLLTGTLAALTLAAGALSSAAPAVAAPWHGGYYHGGYRGWGPGAAVGAGLLGFAIGAAVADRPAYSYGPYYGCPVVTRWNPYWGGYQRVRACY